MRKWKRHVSEFLVLAMLLSQLPLSSNAAEAVDQETESQRAQGRQVTAEEIEGVSLIDNEAISRDEMTQPLYEEDEMVTAIVEMDGPSVMDYYGTGVYSIANPEQPAGQAVADYLASADVKAASDEILAGQESVLSNISALVQSGVSTYSVNSEGASATSE